MTPTQVTEEQARAVAEEARESGWEKPSFAKELFLGDSALDLVHPFPRPDADEAHVPTRSSPNSSGTAAAWTGR